MSPGEPSSGPRGPTPRRRAGPRNHDPTVPAEPRPGKPRPSLSASSPGRHRARLPRDPPSLGPKSTGRPETVPGAAPKGPSRHWPAARADRESTAPRTCVTNSELPERVRACGHREVISEAPPGRMGRALLPSPGKGHTPLGSEATAGRAPGTCRPLSQQRPARTRGYLTQSVGEEEGPVRLCPHRGACPPPVRSRPDLLASRSVEAGAQGRRGGGRAGTAPACRGDPHLPQAGQAAPAPGEGGEDWAGGSGSHWAQRRRSGASCLGGAWVGGLPAPGLGADGAAGMGKPFLSPSPPTASGAGCQQQPLCKGQNARSLGFAGPTAALLHILLAFWGFPRVLLATLRRRKSPGAWGGSVG